MKLDAKHSWIKPFPNRRYQVRLAGSEFEPHQREYHIFALIKHGQISLRYRERNYVLNAGDTLLIPAGEIHAFHTFEGDQADVWFHYIDTVEALDASGHLLLPELDTILSSKGQTLGFTAFLFEQIEQPVHPEHYKHWLKKLVLAVSDENKEQGILSDTSLSALIAAKQYIEQNAELPFCLGEISARFEIDKWQLSRKFKPIFGVTLFQHIHAVRMVRAKDLLAQHYAIADVALSLGYSDQSHFTRFFRRFVGISPKKWTLLVNNDQAY